MKTLKARTILVRKVDIKTGSMCDSGRCPVALALLRSFSAAEKVAVGGANSIYIYEDGTLYRWFGPKKVDIFIEKFDDDLKVNPFSFIIKPVVIKKGVKACSN